MMDTKIVPFPLVAAAKPPLALFVRIGEAHKKLADLHASGRLPAKRVVVDASRVRHQKELIEALQDDGAEIVLDTEAAELAAPSKISGHSRHAPWALAGEGGLVGPDHFGAGARSDVIGQIARFAVAVGSNTVLAPAHNLGDPSCSDWSAVDARACALLRDALDKEGGRHIAIDYPVIAPHTFLNSDAFRGALIGRIVDLPIDNVWVRASGLGADAGPLTMKRYLSAMAGMHNMGKPIIADQLGGLPGLVAMAFGAVSGVAQGIGERERFDARGWFQPPPVREDDDGFGRAVRIGIPGLGRSATIKELELLATARGGRKLVTCLDRKCCLHGLKDMIDDPRRHAAYQAFSSVQALENIPHLSREHHLLNGPIAEADRLAREIKRLKPSDAEAALREIDLPRLMKRFHDHSRKVEKLRSTLERVHEARSDETPRARPVPPRQGNSQKAGEDRK